MESEAYLEADDLFYCHPDWERLVDAALAGNLSQLNEVDRVRFLLGVLLGEACNGGMDQWYDNSGAFAAETVDILRLIQAPETARMLESTNQMFPQGVPSKDDDARSEALHELLETSEEFALQCEALTIWLIGGTDAEGEFVVGDEDTMQLFCTYLQAQGLSS